MTVELDVTEKEKAKELAKQVKAAHKDKQTGSVDPMFVHVFDKEKNIAW
ncbi:hypothetical protein [Metabacillus fastidiosus]|nr:hypothetical protein [Metabacillus fastidiosus]MEC2075427.1 hypothetical protein [Metabacillus fastidiosus]